MHRNLHDMYTRLLEFVWSYVKCYGRGYHPTQGILQRKNRGVAVTEDTALMQERMTWEAWPKINTGL